MAVHDVEVQHGDARPLDLGDLLAQARKVRRQDGGNDFNHLRATGYFSTAGPAAYAVQQPAAIGDRPVTIDGFSTRIDHYIGTSDRIFGQFLFQDEQAPAKSAATRATCSALRSSNSGCG